LKNRFFDLSEITQKTENETNFKEVIATNYIESQTLLVKNVEKELNRLPNEGEIFDIISLNSFNAFTLILWALQFSEIKKLYVSTYSMSREVSQGLFGLYQRGKVQSMKILISDSMEYRNPTVIDNMKAMCDANVELVFGWNHTKISLMEMQNNTFLSITGSGNFSKNAQYENYIIRNDSTIYDFYKNWFENAKIK